MMKKIRKNIIKSIIATALSAAILLTGITFGDTTTAYAKISLNPDGGKKATAYDVQSIRDIIGQTVTMKVGETKSFDYMDDRGSFGYDNTGHYNWSSSDESIVSMKLMYNDRNPDKVAFFILKGEKEGTVTINGTVADSSKIPDVSITVVVSGAEKAKTKMTAKQKACKHSWKVTKKATCVRYGEKACKKCKLKATIQKKDHKLRTFDEQQTEVKEYSVYECNSCVCEDPEMRKYHTHVNMFDCENRCFAQFREKEYGSKDAALAALYKHYDKYDHSGSVVEKVEYADPYKVTVTITECKNCGITKEKVDQHN